MCIYTCARCLDLWRGDSSCGDVAEEERSPDQVRRKRLHGRGAHGAQGWSECESQRLGMGVCIHAACICI